MGVCDGGCVCAWVCDGGCVCVEQLQCSDASCSPVQKVATAETVETTSKHSSQQVTCAPAPPMQLLLLLQLLLLPPLPLYDHCHHHYHYHYCCHCNYMYTPTLHSSSCTAATAATAATTLALLLTVVARMYGSSQVAEARAYEVTYDIAMLPIHWPPYPFPIETIPNVRGARAGGGGGTWQCWERLMAPPRRPAQVRSSSQRPRRHRHSRSHRWRSRGRSGQWRRAVGRGTTTARRAGAGGSARSRSPPSTAGALCAAVRPAGGGGGGGSSGGRRTQEGRTRGRAKGNGWQKKQRGQVEGLETSRTRGGRSAKHIALEFSPAARLRPACGFQPRQPAGPGNTAPAGRHR